MSDAYHEPREEWASRLGFLLAMLGAMVGLGNIWRFPYLTGLHGGGAFVLAYVVLLYVVAVPGLMGETAMGRFTRAATVGAFRRLGGHSGVGVLVALATFGLMTYYFPVIGWVIYYFGHAVAGTFFQEAFTAEAAWEAFKADPQLKLGTHTLAVLLAAIPLYYGVSRGIERASLVMVPLFFAALVVVAGRALTLPAAEAGLAYMFTPEWGQLADPAVWVAALGQALFSTGLGWGIALTLGSYLGAADDIPLGAGVFTAVGNTSIGVLAGLAVLPTVFAFGVDPASGPELVFLALPQIFPEMAGGYLWSLVFFVGFLFAALTSGFAITEVPVAAYREEAGVSRERAVVMVMAAIWLLGLPSALSTDFSGLMDFLFGNWALPAATLASMLVLGWRFGARRMRVLDVNYSADLYVGPWWETAIRYVLPVILIFLLAWFTWDAFAGDNPLQALGGLGFLAGLLVVAFGLGGILGGRAEEETS